MVEGLTEHEAHTVDNDRVVDVRQRFEKEEKHVPRCTECCRVIVV